MLCQTTAYVSLKNIEHNISVIRSHLDGNTKIMAAVKGDAYGHGVVAVATRLSKIGVNSFAVACLDEALQLRNILPDSEILILGYTPAECAETLANNNISQCVYSFEYGLSLASYAEKCSQKVKIHLKLDTGMGRIGFLCREIGENELYEALELCKNRNLIPEGIFTHFATADDAGEGEEYTRLQYANFRSAVSFLEENGVKFEILHCANSAATFNYPEFRLDMVRVGLALYGLTPFDSSKVLPSLRPAMSLRSVISHVKLLRCGESVSYGRIFKADKDMRVATVPVG